ncbi:MAG: fumarate hydratase [Candidatus Cloacimonetes bacterium HGW-Cloacimonetes-2]|jgi:fumarate hydratase subunit alpha|nr:MAG: fumarate hydratase [Candidatus Cloacimonetes bacterium HGW-Cloacimonetes-2]
MRTIDSSVIRDRVVEAYRKLSFELDGRLLESLKEAKQREREEAAQLVLQDILDNAEIARAKLIPPCQDTGTQVFFVELGQEVLVTGKTLEAAINEAVSIASRDNYLRASIVKDPLYDRTNTRDNTPVVFHVKLVEGKKLTVTIAQKGGGAENMSRLYMMSPSSVEQDIIETVVKTVLEAGAKACPPLILGIGIGGNFESAPQIAKHALLRELGTPNDNARYAALEKQILVRLNESGIGAQGLGGSTTALAVHIEQAPCHIASLPLAINIQCHAHRHIRIEL